jgi:ATP-dependent Clp protease ATP-binding subunit ClpC
LGIAREEQFLFRKMGVPTDRLRPIYESLFIARPPISTSIEVPLSPESKRVLKRAAEEADKFGHNHIGSEHILLALFAEVP